jgi:biopolymer transport protein ExbB
MGITTKLVTFTLLGSEWILYLMGILSLISVAIMIDRIRYFASHRVELDVLISDLRGFLKQRDIDGAHQKWASKNGVEVVVGLAGLKEAPRGITAASEAMKGAKARMRPELERNLPFLATLGNNAPFIGLLGTVLGIIRAFRDLSENTQSGSQAVMAGISEALVATAIGLVVALPAVFMFNYFNRRVRRSLNDADVVAHAVLIELAGGGSDTRVRGVG